MGINLQGAQYGSPVPVVYGQNLVAGNVIDYWGFSAQSQSQKVGKGGGGATTKSYTYKTSYLNGICEGPISSIVNVWEGTSQVILSTLAPFEATGTMGQAAWSALPSGHQLGYSLTALFGVENMDLGGSPSIPNYNYEVKALLPFSASVSDAEPSAILTDICTSEYHGIKFPYLGDLTQYHDYCVANSLFLSPAYQQQQTGVQTLTDLFANTNAYAYFSEGVLKVVPLGDVAVTGNGVTYTPNVTPLYDLGYHDFICDAGKAPVQITRKAPTDCLNVQWVQFVDRSQHYIKSEVVAPIDDDVVRFGARANSSVNVNGCTSAAVARFIAQNMVQRAFYVRNTYRFKLPFRYCLLEPADIVTLTDPACELDKSPVRITQIEEDGTGLLTVDAEEFPEGIGHSAIYATQENQGATIDQNADPEAVNAPALFRGPGFLTSPGQPEIWCAVCGSGALWAGAQVYISHDGDSYTYVGAINAPARYGTTTTVLPSSAADPDTTDTLGVDLYAPAELDGGSQADADNLNTLALVGAELIAYETATLTGTDAYNLTYLRRGCYGSQQAASLPAGAMFVRLDDAIYRIPVDASLIGQTVYLKFLSLNVFGRTPRTLAEETAYEYVVGTNVELPDVPDVPDNFAAQPIADGAAITWTNDNPAAVGCTSIEYATASAGPFTVLAQIGPTTTVYHHSFTNGATYWYRARARGPLPQSGWSAYTAAESSTGKTVENGAMNLANHTQDDLPNGSKYARTLGVALQSGLPVGATLGASNLVPNPSFESNLIGTTIPSVNMLAGDLCDGWEVGENAAFTCGIQQLASRVRTGNNSLRVALTSGIVIPNGTQQPGGAWTSGNFPCNGGDAFYVGGYMYHDASVQEPAGVVITANIVLRFYDSTGAYISQEGAEWTQPAGGSMTVPVGATIHAPANATSYKVYCLGLCTNQSGASITTNSAWAGLSFDDVFVYHVTSLDNEVSDGATYQRMPTANMDANRRALIDFTQSAHVGKHLGNIPDDLTSNRYAVYEIDANRRPYIDFTQTGHVGKSLANIPDDASSARYAVQAVDSNRKAIIDLSQAHLNKTLDYLPDGPSRAALAAHGVLNGTVTRSGMLGGIAMGRNFLFNPTGALGLQGWIPFTASGSATLGADMYSGGRFHLITSTAGTNAGIHQVLGTQATQAATTFWVSADVEIDSITVGSGLGVGIDLFDSTAGVSLGQQFVTSSGTIAFETAAPSAAGHTLDLRLRVVADACSAYIYRVKCETGDAPSAYSDDYGNALVTQTHNPAGGIGQDGLMDGGTYWRLAAADQVSSGGVNRLGLRVAGSGQQVGDQGNLKPITYGSLGAMWSGGAISYTSTNRSATVTIPALTLHRGSAGPINYAARTYTFPGSGPATVTLWLFYEDPTVAGGSPPLVGELSGNQTAMLDSDAYILIGTISITFPAAGGTGGGSGPAPTGCPCLDQWVLKRGWFGIPYYVHAGSVKVGDRLRLVNGTWGRVSFAETELQPCMRISTDDRVALECSQSAPLLDAAGRDVVAVAADGASLLTRTWGAVTTGRRVRADSIGRHAVRHITIDDAEHHFWCGATHGLMLAHHNMKLQPV